MMLYIFKKCSFLSPEVSALDGIRGRGLRSQVSLVVLMPLWRPITRKVPNGFSSVVWNPRWRRHSATGKFVSSNSKYLLRSTTEKPPNKTNTLLKEETGERRMFCIYRVTAGLPGSALYTSVYPHLSLLRILSRVIAATVLLDPEGG